jgi:hypothetical protein
MVAAVIWSGIAHTIFVFASFGKEVPQYFHASKPRRRGHSS